MRPCPACARKVQDAAQKCHYCGAAIPHAPRADRLVPKTLVTPTPARSLGFTAALIGAIVALLVGLIIMFYR